MKDADKTLIDSVLSVFRFAVSNKTAPKWHENAPIFGRGRVKIKSLNSRITATGAKVSIIFGTTKKPHDGGSFPFSFFVLLFYASSIRLPSASAMRDNTSMLVA